MNSTGWIYFSQKLGGKVVSDFVFLLIFRDKQTAEIEISSSSLRFDGKLFFVFAQRPVPIRILTVGKKRSRGVQLIVDEYIEKLKYYCSPDDIQIRSNPKNARFVASLESSDLNASLILLNFNSML